MRRNRQHSTRFPFWCSHVSLGRYGHTHPCRYGKDYDYEAPVKLLDALLHGMAGREGEQVVVLSQVLAADVNLGYEDICNTQVGAQEGF